MELLKALQWRYAVKQFSDKKVAPDNLKKLLNNTRLSASSYGLQPYKIIVIESQEIRNSLLPYSYGQSKVAESSHLILFAADTNVGDHTVERYMSKHAAITGKSEEELSGYSSFVKSAINQQSVSQKQEWANQQAYIALGNFLTCAAVMKIDSCPMTGFDKSGYDSILGLAKQNLTTTVICPIGYRHTDDSQALNPKVRFDYDELIMEI